MTPSLLALLLIVAFVLHDGEETLVMQRWQKGIVPTLCADSRD